MKDQPTKKDFIRRIESAKKRIVKGRDELRAIQDDMESVLGSSDYAVDQLDGAIQTLSEYL